MKGAPSSFAFSTIHSASCQLYELRHTDHRQQGSARTCTQALSGSWGRGGTCRCLSLKTGTDRPLEAKTPRICSIKYFRGKRCCPFSFHLKHGQ